MYVNVDEVTSAAINIVHLETVLGIMFTASYSRY